MLEVITGKVATAVPENRMLGPPQPRQKEFSPPMLLYITNPSSNHAPVYVIGAVRQLSSIYNLYTQRQVLLPSRSHSIGNFPIIELDEVDPSLSLILIASLMGEAHYLPPIDSSLAM